MFKVYEPKIAFSMKPKRSKTKSDPKSKKNPENTYRALNTNKIRGSFHFSINFLLLSRYEKLTICNSVKLEWFRHKGIFKPNLLYKVCLFMHLISFKT